MNVPADETSKTHGIETGDGKIPVQSFSVLCELTWKRDWIVQQGGRGMDSSSLTQQFFQQLINGVSLGSIYALIALGYTMVYGIIRLINFAHGDIYMLGAYAGYFATTSAYFKLPKII